MLLVPVALFYYLQCIKINLTQRKTNKVYFNILLMAVSPTSLGYGRCLIPGLDQRIPQVRPYSSFGGERIS